MKKNNLDERQEQIMLKIEHNGFWIAFWMLLAAMLGQQIFFGPDIKVIGGECLILLVISLYVVIACLRNGIWDRRLNANMKTNIIASLIAGLVVGLVMIIALHRAFPDSPAGATAGGIISGVVTAVLCIIALTVAMCAYKKKNQTMEEEPEDDMEM